MGDTCTREGRCGRGTVSAVRPRLVDEMGQIVCPVLLSHPARINQVGQIVFAVGKNKRRVADSIVFNGERYFSGSRYPGSPLGCLDGCFASSEADEPLIETIEPRAQFFTAITCGIGCDEYHL